MEYGFVDSNVTLNEVITSLWSFIQDNLNIFIGVFIIYLLLFVLLIISLWNIFGRFDKPKWASLIPFYRWYVLCDLLDYPGIISILLYVPLINIIFSVILYYKLVKLYDKNFFFIFGLIFFPIIFMLILAFSKKKKNTIPLLKCDVEVLKV